MTTTELETWSTRPKTMSPCRKHVEFGEDHHKHKPNSPNISPILYIHVFESHVLTLEEMPCFISSCVWRGNFSKGEGVCS